MDMADILELCCAAYSERNRETDKNRDRDRGTIVNKHRQGE